MQRKRRGSLGLEHHQLELHANDFANNLEEVLNLLDEPIGDPACFAVLRLCRFARGHVKGGLCPEKEAMSCWAVTKAAMRDLETMSRRPQIPALACLRFSRGPRSAPTHRVGPGRSIAPIVLPLPKRFNYGLKAYQVTSGIPRAFGSRTTCSASPASIFTRRNNIPVPA